jgi:hypothetical protein
MYHTISRGNQVNLLEAKAELQSRPPTLSPAALAIEAMVVLAVAGTMFLLI